MTIQAQSATGYTPRLRWWIPFASLHWQFWLLLCWGLFELFMAAGCKNFAAQYPWSRFETFCVVAVCSALWSAHARALRDEGGRLISMPFVAAYNLTTLALCVAGAFFALKIATGGTFDCMPRSGVQSNMDRAAPVKEEIAHRVTVHRPATLTGIASGLAMPANVLITPDGVVAVIGEWPPMVAFFSPTLENGSLKWTCVGEPASIMPASCRPPTATAPATPTK
jgi:hypothetical protein